MNNNFKLVETIYHNRVAELPILSKSLLSDALIRAENQIYLFDDGYSDLDFEQIKLYSEKFSDALKITIKNTKC